MPGGRDDEERVTAGDKCGGEQLIWKRKEHRRKKGGKGVSGLIQDGSDQLDTGEHNISLDLDPTPIHWRGAPKGSVDEEPVSDHWHNSNANDAAGLENDHADKKEKRGAFRLLESFQSLDFQWQLAGG